jgi:hypothetical protein
VFYAVYYKRNKVKPEISFGHMLEEEVADMEAFSAVVAKPASFASQQGLDVS